MILICEMEKQENFENKETGFIHHKAYFQSGTHINHEIQDVKVIMKEMINKILENLRAYQENGSAWYFKEVISLEIHLVENKPMKGGTYIPLPKFIQNKNAIINIQNEDDKCFLWSILRYLHPKEIHAERITDLKKYENELNFEDIKFPVKLKDIAKFEKQNPNLPRIGVFSVNEDNKINPLRLKKTDCKNSIDLFLHSDGERQHYSLIKNFSKLVRSQITKDTTRKILICKRCFCHYTKEELLEKHINYCGNNETALIRMPTKKK